MKAALVSLALIVAGSCLAQAPASAVPASSPGAEVSFHLERPGLPVPKFTITVHEDGSGTYVGEEAPVSGGPGAPAAAGRPINRPIKLSHENTDTIFKTARSLDYFNIACESKLKNIADTGKKTLSYSGTDGHGSCLYNYSENKQVTQLTDLFHGIAFTMDEGRRLDFLHRFDRLGLYSEMDVLMREVQEKRALEIGNIAPSLNSIVGDEALMQKVRERAAKLLATADTSAGH